MDPLIVGAATGGLFLLIGLSTGRLRRGWAWSVLAAFIAVFAGLYLQYVSTSSPLAGFAPDRLWLLIAWIELAYLVSISGLRPKGNLGLLAFCGGAILTDLGATAIIAPFAGSSKNRGRVALTASAGAMLTTGGTPARLLFESVDIHPLFPIILALVVWPKGSAMRDLKNPMKRSTTDDLGKRLKWVMPSCISAFLLIESGLPTFWVISGLDLVLIFIIGPKRMKTPWQKELYILAIATLAALAVTSGTLHQLQLACSHLVNTFGNLGAAAVALMAVLFSGVGGEGAGSLVLVQSFQGVAHAPPAALQHAAIIGLAIGGVGPLIVAKAFKDSLGLFAFQFGLMIVLVITCGA